MDQETALVVEKPMTLLKSAQEMIGLDNFLRLHRDDARLAQASIQLHDPFWSH